MNTDTRSTDTLWQKQNGLIYFSVTSDGTTREQWSNRLHEKGYRVGERTQQVLRSPDFQVTSGITTKVVIIPGALITAPCLNADAVRAEARKQNVTTPRPEIACLMREKLNDALIRAMGFKWLVVMHTPISITQYGDRLLVIDSDGGGRRLTDDGPSPSYDWRDDDGFAFVEFEEHVSTA